MKNVKNSLMLTVVAAVLAGTTLYFAEALRQQQPGAARALFDQAMTGGIPDQASFDLLVAGLWNYTIN